MSMSIVQEDRSSSPSRDSSSSFSSTMKERWRKEGREEGDRKRNPCMVENASFLWSCDGRASIIEHRRLEDRSVMAEFLAQRRSSRAQKNVFGMTVMLIPLWMYAIHERDTAWTIENWISSGRIRIERSRLYEREEKNFSPPFATLETKMSRANVGWFIRVKGGESRIRIQRIKIISIRFFFHENFFFPRNFVSDVSERWTQRVGSTEEEAWI